MVNKMLLAVILLAAVADAHYLYGHSSTSKSQTVKQRICSKNSLCPPEAVCCLKAYQGRCYYGSFSKFYGYKRTLPTESATCLKGTSLTGYGVDSKCANDGDCDRPLVCDKLSSNRWGVCKEHICDDTSSSACSNHKCVKDATGPGYKCNCELTSSGTTITQRSNWKKGKECEEAHQCANEHLCGDMGTCYRADNDPDKMKCECDAEWYGEKCNIAGACMVDSFNDCNKQAACTSTGPSYGNYKCDCDNTNGEGRNCNYDICSGCGTGKCVYTHNGFDDNDVWQADGACKCPVNKYGPSCEADCGGGTLPDNVTISGSDALCVYEAAAFGGLSTVQVKTDQSILKTDPFCITYYVEAFKDADNVPMDNTANTVLKRCPSAGPSADLKYLYGFATVPNRLVLSIKAGTFVAIVTT